MQPAYQGIDSVYKSQADNKDIRDLLEQLVPKATAQMVQFSNQFKGATEQETCRKIFTYLKNNFRYVADGGEQVIKLPSALLKKKVGDCKSYSLFTAAILENLKIPYHFVYASYNSNPIPGHVYVTTNKGCIIDAVYGTFNKEKKPNYKYKKNMNVRYMAGINDSCDCDNPSMGKITLISKEKRDKAAADLKKARDKGIDAAKKAARAAEEAAKKIRDKATQGLKTVAFAPGRNLFLLLIKNNFDGIASKIALGSTTDMLTKWNQLGGDRTILSKTIKEGASKRARKFGLLSKLKKIVGNTKVNGIGEIPSKIEAGIISATTSAGTAIGGAPQGTAAGASLGKVIVELLPTLLSVLQNTPASDGEITTSDTGGTDIFDAGGGTSDDDKYGGGDTGGGGNVIYDKDGNILKLDPKGGGVLESKSGKNTMLYVGGALVLAAGIYFATKKK